MPSKHTQTVFIHDSCLFIDLFSGGILENWFSCGFHFETTVFIIDELKQPELKKAVETFVSASILIIHDLSFEETAAADTWAKENRVSLQDASVALMAQERKGILLTGDQRLRTKSQQKGIDVRGVLWILDTLVNAKKIDGTTAFAALQTMLSKGKSRLPKEECKKRETLWRNVGA